LWQVEAQRYRVRTDIRTRFYAALGAQKQIALAREFKIVAQKGVTIADERLKAQVGTRPDILQSEIQVNEVELTIQRAEFDFEAAWQELAAVAGVPYLPPSTILGSFASNMGERDIDSAHARIVAESPLLKSANEQVKRARINLHRQQVQATPNVTYQVGAARDNATGSEVVNLQVSLPLPVHNANQGNIQAAHAAYCQATQNVQRINMQIRRNLAQVMRNYKSAAATVQRYESAILPKASESLELILNAQAAGEIEFLRVLTARRVFFDVNLKYVSALVELSQANAEIEGLLLTGGLSNTVSFDGGDDLRGQALSGQ
jgi:cobalt-zinc-cadmium efflux system outer membrane protein